MMKNSCGIFQNTGSSSDRAKQGFLAFALGAIFLLSLVSSGALFSDFREGNSYQKYQLLQLQEVAAKRAFYSAMSESAREAMAEIAAAEAAGAPVADPRAFVRGRLLLRALEFSSGMRAQGHDFAIWCGSPGEQGLQEAFSQMAASASSVVPTGATAFSTEFCADSLDADMESMRIHFSSVGFSEYFPDFGMGYAVQLPSAYEMDAAEGLA